MDDDGRGTWPTQGIRSYAPDLPLGSHPIALGADADLSPRGVARLVLDFLAALDLTDVTLVGNDTGGALCQFLIDTDATRIGRLVLTNCDAFDKFPPPPFGAIVALRPASLAAARLPAQRAARRFVRHSVLGFGGLGGHPAGPRADRGAGCARRSPTGRSRRDTARFMRGIDKRDLPTWPPDWATSASRSCWSGARPTGSSRSSSPSGCSRRSATRAWSAIDGGRTFVPYDSPDRLADEIRAFCRQPA